MTRHTILREAGGVGGGLGRASVYLAMLVLFATAACSGRSGTTKGAGKASTSRAKVDGDANRFPHELHTGDHEKIRAYKDRGLQCADCHPQEDVQAGGYARPGGNEHSPCDVCHKEEFYKPPGEFCQNCHIEVNLRKAGVTTMQPYPERGTKKVLAATFSHKVHLDEGAMEGAVGFHVACQDCHSRDEKTGDPVLPGHKECARCHTKEKAQRIMNMTECAECHPQQNVDIGRVRLMITEGLIFSHGDHVKDKSGAAIGCEQCHQDIPESDSVKDVSIPLMRDCAKCHQDPARTPSRVRIANCTVCHDGIVEGNTPKNHLVGDTLPENHTLEFRSNHAEQARNKNANCKFCHENLSGSSRDNCFQCHEVMRPRDHMMGWRNDSHGREAAVDRDRCATCHNVDYCTACHAIPPRSHQPLGEFRLGGHAEIAQFDLRSCMACHTYEDTCARCHREVR